jgi:diaminohydroxyphosphoribosylaminopyrimidine deaminase/5-amino-6-(5-phosphoribosylamino)uracil reductase
MRQALLLAENAVGLASPNPTVGCVIVRNGVLVGRGAHLYDHLDHAEVVALREAGELARSATAYVTLEPCSHTGRTGPCADALVRAGVSRVVVATGDPNPLVSGSGLTRLRDAGIDVTVGVLADHARQLNDGFARFIRYNLPFVTLKAGLSLDGRIAPAPPDPPTDAPPATIYLTSPRSLVAVQRMRHASDAVLTGIGTVLKDNPLLTDRSGLPRRRPLLRIVLDSDLRLPLHSRLVESTQDDVLVYTANASTDKADQLRHAGVQIEPVDYAPLTPEVEPLLPARPDPTPVRRQLDLRAILTSLANRKLLNLLVEGGSHLNRALLTQDHVDKLRLFYAPLFLGEAAVPLIAGPGSLHPELHRSALTHSGDDFCFEAHLRDPWHD